MKKKWKILFSAAGLAAAAGILLSLHFLTASPSAKAVNAAPASSSSSPASAASSSSPAAESTSSSVRQDLPPTGSHPEDVPTEALNPKQKVAYLTFDDGPSSMTPQLLSTLADCKVKATFFVVGLQAEAFPGALKQIAQQGHTIGVHSWTHQYPYIYKNTQNFLQDFNQLKDYIYQQTGTMPNICRFPGGTNNTVFRHYNNGPIMSDIVSLVHGMGFEYYDWNVSSGEASAVPPSKDVIVNRVVSQCKNVNTAVILFHDTENKGYVAAVPEIVAKLRSMGFAFETLSPSNPPKFRAAAVQFKPAAPRSVPTAPAVPAPAAKENQP